MGNKAKSFYKATEMFLFFSVPGTTLRSHGEEQNRKGAFLKNIGSSVLQSFLQENKTSEAHQAERVRTINYRPKKKLLKELEE